MLLAAGGAAGIYGVLTLNRIGGDPQLAETLRRLPDKNALTIHVDLAAIRKAGLAPLLEGTPVAEEAEYRRFVQESGFDWKTDLDGVTASKSGADWFFFVNGRFDLEKLRNYALQRGGACRNGICDVMGATAGRRVSFYPASGRSLILASSNRPNAVYDVYTKNKPEWVGGVPEGPLWVSFNGSVLAGDPALPSGARLFGKVLAETQRTTFSIAAAGPAMELRMRAHSNDAAAAEMIKAQLEGVTVEFRKYFERLGQTAASDDLSGLLLSGQFSVSGNETTGRWPLSPEFLKKLATGGL